ncbi:MAG TPA: class I SAM-dependent methyltransferase [bacterium]|jgi:2-polyprenyl-3-methyl-5-hydroxy-6-metoxy-1,4-benzoquinol methylase|nr:class I SAM-dependent methyltransferase [bacterium]
MDIEEYALAHPKDEPAKIQEQIIRELKKLKKGSKILDIGCAEGATIRFLADMFGNKFKYTGVDLSKERISIAKNKKTPNTNFIVSTGEKINLQSSSYDCILCSQVLEHVEDEDSLISEIKRLLKPNGIFQIDTVYKKPWAWYFYKAPIGWAIDPTHLREYTDISSISKIIERNGLTIDTVYTRKDTRNLKMGSLFDIEIPIPGYYTLFVLGKNK